MAAITKLTHALSASLEKKLTTTQLIFIHARTIDISFRSDERRFDVEGAYNIRYEIIKKRIDKALIKNTNERLTQPGKIAIVYTDNKIMQEYAPYFLQLQQENMLTGNVEYLELEELQGVRGLRAVRLSVVLNN